MSHYLIGQLANRSNINALYRTEVVAAHGETSLEAIDVRNAATGETTRLESGGLFIFIGADAETAWLPLRSRSIRRATCSPGLTCAPMDDGRATGTRISSRRAFRASSRAATSGSVLSKRVASAVGEGSMAIAFVHQYLNETRGPAEAGPL